MPIFQLGLLDWRTVAAGGGRWGVELPVDQREETNSTGRKPWLNLRAARKPRDEQVVGRGFAGVG